MNKKVSIPEYFRRPEQLIAELGIETPEEIDVDAIAEYCNATIVYESLKGCDASILGKGDRAYIAVNSDSNMYRQRFSAAHELGHWMYDRGKVGISCSESSILKGWRDLDPERMANKYAADLLMPREMFKRHALNLGITIETVKKLASIFRTSLTATAIRLVEYGSFPAALVCSEGGRRLWYVLGPGVPRELRIRELPKKGALSLTALNRPISELLVDEIDADIWIDHPDSYKFVIQEEAVRINDQLVLSLLWWKNEDQILDLIIED